MNIALQKQFFSEDLAVVEDLKHNEVIELIAKYAVDLGYEVHVGETEQRKEKRLKDISIPMISNVEYGIPLNAFSSIKEIDLIVIDNYRIVAAFEVAVTATTANKAINDRYRNLFASFPSWPLIAAVVVKTKDYGYTTKELHSLANEKQHVSGRVKILRIRELSPTVVKSLLKP